MFMKRKLTYSMSLLILVVSIFCFMKNPSTDVQAEETGTLQYTTFEERDDYALAICAGTVAKSYVGKNAPVIDTEGYLFAGWFTGAECKLEQGVKTVTSVIDNGTYYAKFVPMDVLSVKAQVSTRDVNSDESVDARNIRFVSSVDTLNYSRVGFSLKFVDENGIVTDTKTSTSKDVFKRISSATTGDEYNFAPKVIDTKSERLFTATWKGTDNTGVDVNAATGFHVQAYWKTLDGITVYGQSRYVTVSQGLEVNSHLINMSIEKGNLSKGSPIKVVCGDEDVTSVSGSVIYTDDIYAHIVINMGTQKRNELKSATTFTIKDESGTTLATEVYRNFFREATLGTADTSWYEAYSSDTSEEKEYVIATASDLYGLASVLKDTDNFASDKIYLIKDITVNSGTIKDMSADQKAQLTPWTPMGKTGKVFVGKFDGQGCSISGLYSSTDTNYTGLFAQTGANAEIRNLILSNSYFANTNASAYGLGSVVGLVVGGTFDSIYCTNDVVVESAGQQTGGVIGRLSLSNAVYHINNCWFDGQVNVTGTSSRNVYCGGIVGCVVQGTLNISNCLNTGSVSYTCTATPTTTLMVGGICGGTMNATAFLNMSNCFNTGVVSAPIESGVAGLLGYGNNVNTTEGKYQWTFNNCYVLETACATGFYKVKDGAKASKTNTDFVSNADNSLVGHQSYTSDLFNLGLYSYCKSDSYTEESRPYWVVNIDGMPTLKDFTTDWVDVGWYYENNPTDDGADIFTISTAEELYGFSTISQGFNFAKDTIQLGDNIDVNSAIVSVSAIASPDKNAGIRTWTPIGSDFAGTFDGNNKTIKGVYVNTTNANGGFFAKTVHGSIVKNFRLVDSYIYVNNTSAEAGSIAGYGAGTFENIYSNAVVTSTKNRAGGIVGRFQDGTLGTSVSFTIDDENTGWIKHCWFDGSVTVSDSGACVGGIVAGVLNGKVEISGCLNTGKIVSGKYAAGLCGRGTNNAYLVMADSIGAGGEGAITGDGTNVGSIVAGVTGKGGLELTRVFVTSESCTKRLANISCTKTGAETLISEDDITITHNNNWVVSINHDETVETITLGTCGR